MLSARTIFEEIFDNDEAFRLFCSIAAAGEAQGGWENGRIAALVPASCQDLAPKIARHGADEDKHGRIFTALLRKRGLQPVPVPADTDYTMRLERIGLGLAHSQLRRDEKLSEYDILAYLAHSRVTEQRASEQMRALRKYASSRQDIARAVTILVPFQVWLPRGYAAAPGPARAIMAGVCVNVAFYGMWRTFALIGRAPGWLTGGLLVLGALSALLGIAHAAVQNRLSRVIAYSSVENTGLIVTGFGVALTGAAVGDRRLVAAGLLAATLQVVTHTVAKSLLFTSSAGIEAATGADDLEELRGRARRTPWSGFGLAVGSLTLAGLPPTVGFVSEWFLLESLMQQFRVPGLGYRLVLALAGAAVALTVGFAGVTFVRLVGLVCLGGSDPPQTPPALGGTARPPKPPWGWAGPAAVVVLALGCLATAAVTPLEIRVIAAGLSPAVPASLTMGTLKSPWVLQPVFDGFSILSPSWLWVEMPLMLLLTVLFAWAVSGRRLLRVRRVPAWRSATIGVEGADSYTAFGYANPTRRVLAGVLHTRAELREVMMTEDGRDDGSGPPDRPDPAQGEAAAHLRYASDVIEVVETYVYRPALGFFMAVVTAAKRLQSGRLDAYLLYMLIALIAVVTALA